MSMFPIRALLIAAAATLPVPLLSQPPAAPAVAESPDAALKRLFAESDEASLKRNPISAIFRGDLRYADRLGDFGSDAYFDAERAAAQQDLKRLKAIDRAALTPVNQIAYDVFEYNMLDTLETLPPQYLAVTAVRPIDHFFGLHVFYPGFASGKGAAPFKTLTDYENNLKRHRDYVAVLDRSITRFREGM